MLPRQKCLDLFIKDTFVCDGSILIVPEDLTGRNRNEEKNLSSHIVSWKMLRSELGTLTKTKNHHQDLRIIKCHKKLAIKLL